jgi:checkpoint serine/threonine-protein kinase
MSTHFNDIEPYKENIQPLTQGRSAASLAQSLKDPASLEVERQRYELAIEHVQDLDDDPLDAYWQYVRWLQTQSTLSTTLSKILETCVRRFKNDARYRNDPRYLKLWLLVAQQSKQPSDVFKYLSVNRIGIELALFYEEYAKLLETVGRYLGKDSCLQK